MSLMSAVHERLSFRTGHKKKPCTKKDAHVYNLKNTDKATFYFRIEARAMLAPTSTSPEERGFVVDSGASMHMLSKKVLSSDELETLRRSRNPTVVVTANGEVQTIEEAQKNVHDLDLFVTVQLLEVTPAVQSLGKLCEDQGYSYEWVRGQKPRLTKEGKTMKCNTDNFVPLVVPGLSTNSGSNPSSTSTLQDLCPTKQVQPKTEVAK